MVEDRGGLAVLHADTPESLVCDLKKAPSVGTADTQFRANTPQIFLDIDRSRVASLGLPSAFTARATASYGRDCALLAFARAPAVCDG